jgi:hypothetical protein
VLDGIWSKLDALHIYATQDSTTALLNLVSASYNGVANGSPVFTVDRGFQGVSASTTVYIDTGFNPRTASSPQFTQNSAHLGVWSNTATQLPDALFGSRDGSVDCYFLGQYSSDGFKYWRLNCGHNAGNFATVQPANSNNGFYVASRSSSLNTAGYQNGSSLNSSSSDGSNLPPNMNLYSIAINNNGAASGCAAQQCAISIGSNLTATDVTNFYNRLRIYMTAVGVP